MTYDISDPGIAMETRDCFFSESACLRTVRSCVFSRALYLYTIHVVDCIF